MVRRWNASGTTSLVCKYTLTVRDAFDSRRQQGSTSLRASPQPDYQKLCIALHIWRLAKSDTKNFISDTILYLSDFNKCVP
jgi:hypothetical protein